MTVAPSDSTAIFAHVLRREDSLKRVIPVMDPRLRRRVLRILGPTWRRRSGGRLTPGFSPLKVTGIVVHLGDGRFEISGPILGGDPAFLGRIAILLVEDRLSVLLTGESGLTRTPAAFTSQSIDLGCQNFIVVKSGMHCRANFAGVATPLALATPGLSFPNST